LIDNNKFVQNRSAITAKDESKVYLSNNKYVDNKISVEMYQKKKIFKHPSIFNINEEHKINEIKKTVKSHYLKLDIKENVDLESITIFEELNRKNWIKYE